jgi:hypothetical protein
MAEDARISTALPRHPKTVKLRRRLGDTGCWALVCLFLWVAENRHDGNLEALTDEDLEIAAGWVGAGGEFVNALVEVGFLDGEPGKFRVHDWAEHNPWAASRGRRVEAAKIAACQRWQHHPHANRMRTASVSQESVMPTTQPKQTQTKTTCLVCKGTGKKCDGKWCDCRAADDLFRKSMGPDVGRVLRKPPIQ